jgi:hypothetical protein
MILHLDTEHRFRGTETCWEFQRLKVYKGVQQWVTLGYYRDLVSAARAAYRREIRTDPAVGLAEALDAAERLIRKYAAVFDDPRAGSE